MSAELKESNPSAIGGRANDGRNIRPCDYLGLKGQSTVEAGAKAHPVSNAFPILLYRYSNTAGLHSYSHVFGTD